MRVLSSTLKPVAGSLALALACAVPAPSWAQTPAADAPPIKPALHTAAAVQAQMLDAACAGGHAVAVGERGTVLLTGNAPEPWHQAAHVPVDVLLNGVSFADAQQGWAVGHWGVVLHTTDGGENWTLQRQGLPEDRPLFGVHFFDRQVGVAIGLWGLVLRSDDGGAHWSPVDATGGAKSDVSYFALFTSAQGVLYAVGEHGSLMVSPDQGRSWSVVSTGYTGSLWAGVATQRGTLIVAGLRGAVLRSADQGKTWTRVALPVTDSITGVTEVAPGHVVAVGMDGLVLDSRDEGQTFALQRREDRVPLNGLVPAACAAAPGGALWTVSVQGPQALKLGN